jgi:hypothetical protein
MSNSNSNQVMREMLAATVYKDEAEKEYLESEQRTVDCFGYYVLDCIHLLNSVGVECTLEMKGDWNFTKTESELAELKEIVG